MRIVFLTRLYYDHKNNNFFLFIKCFRQSAEQLETSVYYLVLGSKVSFGSHILNKYIMFSNSKIKSMISILAKISTNYDFFSIIEQQPYWQDGFNGLGL